jgi:hypothetical protein
MIIAFFPYDLLKWCRISPTKIVAFSTKEGNFIHVITNNDESVWKWFNNITILESIASLNEGECDENSN